MTSTPFLIRICLLAALGATLIMIGVKVHSCKSLLMLDGAKLLLAEVVILLLAYATVTAWTGPRLARLRPQSATTLGAIGGILQVIHLLIERFSSLPQPANGVITLTFMLATFLLWGYAGYQASTSGLSFSASCRIAIWSAMVTMTIAVAAGTVLEYFIAPLPLTAINQWAEFKRSGWDDVRAFSVANTMDEASTHLFIGPVVATLFGALGYGLSYLKFSSRRQAVK